MSASFVPWLLGAAWGAIVALPIVYRSRRARFAARFATLVSGRPQSVSTRSTGAGRLFRSVRTRAAVVRRGPVGRVLGAVVRRGRARGDDHRLARELPVVVDLLGVAVGSGCTPYLALEVAAQWAPPVAAAPLASVLRACRLGVGLEDALTEAVQATPLLRPLGDALLTSERLGAPVGPVLARLAAEERTALRRRAEAQARRVPVRLLFPLVFLVLPAFVLLTVVPGLAAGLGRL